MAGKNLPGHFDVYTRNIPNWERKSPTATEPVISVHLSLNLLNINVKYDLGLPTSTGWGLERKATTLRTW